MATVVSIAALVITEEGVLKVIRTAAARGVLTIRITIFSLLDDIARLV